MFQWVSHIEVQGILYRSDIFIWLVQIQLRWSFMGLRACNDWLSMLTKGLLDWWFTRKYFVDRLWLNFCLVLITDRLFRYQLNLARRRLLLFASIFNLHWLCFFLHRLRMWAGCCLLFIVVLLLPTSLFNLWHHEFLHFVSEHIFNARILLNVIQVMHFQSSEVLLRIEADLVF